MQFNICFPLCWKWIEAGRVVEIRAEAFIYFANNIFLVLTHIWHLWLHWPVRMPDTNILPTLSSFALSQKYLFSFTEIPFLFHTNTCSLSHKYLFSYTQIPYLSHKYLFSFIQIPCQPCNPFLFHSKLFQIFNLIFWKHKQSLSFYSVWQKRIHQTMKWQNMNFGANS